MKNIFKDKDQKITGPLVSKTFKIDLDAKKIGKKASIAFIAITATVGLSIGVLIGLNSFFNSHYFEFRSPVIFQAPILLQDRKTESTIEIIKEVEAKEVLEVKKELVLSDRAKECVKNQPIVAMKLEEAFGDEASVAIELVCRESSLNPLAVNKSSGAAGLFQAYPASKLKCDLSDVDCQIAWGKNYIQNRYKTAEAALLFHDQKGWY